MNLQEQLVKRESDRFITQLTNQILNHEHYDNSMESLAECITDVLVNISEEYMSVGLHLVDIIVENLDEYRKEKRASQQQHIV